VVSSFGALAIPVLLLVLHGPIATNILNIYSCSVCAQTLDLRIARRMVVYVVGLIALAFTIFLVFRESFAESLDGWLGGLVTWVAPWAGVMLTHWFVVARREIDVPRLYDDTGRDLPAVLWPGLIAFVLGAVATWACSFGVPTFLQGPVARSMHDVDASWLAGLVVSSALYLVLTRVWRTAPRPAPELEGARA
jgi:purine-cytosine permease-like protein